MLISINRRPLDKPWGGGNMFVKILTQALRENGHSVVFDLPPDIDIIVMIDPRHDADGYSAQHIYSYLKYYPQTRVLHRVNECDKRKGNSGQMDVLLDQANSALAQSPGSVTVFISEWLRAYFEEQGWPKNSPVIYNGCDTNLFKPRTGARQDGPLRLVTHHWSDNWMKGFDIYADIDRYLSDSPDFEFTYVGRYTDKYTPRNTKLIEPLSGHALAEELRRHDIYVTASRWEPCGMHHIEGAASGLPVLYHTEGGGIPEGCLRHGIGFDDFETFLEALNSLRSNLKDHVSRIDLAFLSSKRVSQDYLEIIESMK